LFTLLPSFKAFDYNDHDNLWVEIHQGCKADISIFYGINKTIKNIKNIKHSTECQTGVKNVWLKMVG
jgi:hypothetical protein